MNVPRHLRHWWTGALPEDCPHCVKHLEPWMFGVSIVIDGREIRGEAARLSFIGRVRTKITRRPVWEPMPSMDRE